MKSNIGSRITGFLVQYFTLSGQLVPQSEAEQSIREGVSFSGTNIIILILAILIASLGLNTNSTAVIIGAMLISPLMGPIIGMGLGVGVHDFALIKRCVRNLLMAAAFSMLASTLYFLISPVNEGHSELLARTSPTIYDVLIGFFGGGAGIIALGSRNKGNVIPGVAIATALMPPLCTAGYGIATWQLSYFFGATYLFIINSIYIAFATFIGVKLLGYKGLTSDSDDGGRARRVRNAVYCAAILTMLPSIWLTYKMLRENKFSMKANEFVAEECRFPSTQVLTHSAFMDEGQRIISVTLIGKILPIDSLQLALTPRLAHYGLGGAHLRFIQGASASSSPVPAAEDNTRDIYLLAQSTITRQQQEIDSLNEAARQASLAHAAGAQLAPELKVLFPQISDIAVTRGIFSSVDTAALDTANVALIHFSRPMKAQEMQKLREYLLARLKLKNIDIINVPALTGKKKDKPSSPHNAGKQT
ncbi:MAG: TIGR00341 family protein [Muribaculaceae bacterium]|nr:TIGR00341 family protein [Muribaculaceae bacterium]